MPRWRRRRAVVRWSYQLSSSSASASAQQRGDGRGDQRDEQCRAEPVEAHPWDLIEHGPRDQGIHGEVGEAERVHRQRDEQERERRPDERIDHTDDQTGEHRVTEGVDLEAPEDPRRQQQRVVTIRIVATLRRST